MATSAINPEALKTTIDETVRVNAFVDNFRGKGGWVPSKAMTLLTESQRAVR